jgi:hypothetical protein
VVCWREIVRGLHSKGLAAGVIAGLCGHESIRLLLLEVRVTSAAAGKSRMSDAVTSQSAPRLRATNASITTVNMLTLRRKRNDLYHVASCYLIYSPCDWLHQKYASPSTPCAWYAPLFRTLRHFSPAFGCHPSVRSKVISTAPRDDQDSWLQVMLRKGLFVHSSEACYIGLHAASGPLASACNLALFPRTSAQQWCRALRVQHSQHHSNPLVQMSHDGLNDDDPCAKTLASIVPRKVNKGKTRLLYRGCQKTTHP